MQDQQPIPFLACGRIPSMCWVAYLSGILWRKGLMGAQRREGSAWSGCCIPHCATTLGATVELIQTLRGSLQSITFTRIWNKPGSRGWGGCIQTSGLSIYIQKMHLETEITEFSCDGRLETQYMGWALRPLETQPGVPQQDKHCSVADCSGSTLNRHT